MAAFRLSRDNEPGVCYICRPLVTRIDGPFDPDALFRIGIVLSVDLDAAQCIVQIGDSESDAIKTPDVRWGTSRVGKTRVWSPPVYGAQVLVAFPACRKYCRRYDRIHSTLGSSLWMAATITGEQVSKLKLPNQHFGD